MQIPNTRLSLITGKGGVGRTAVAAAMARAAAAEGKRVLVTEISDPEATSSALANVLGLQTLEPDPQPISENLFACHLWARRGHEQFLSSVLPARLLIRAAMRSQALRKFLAAAPSFSEMGVFNHFLSLLKEQNDDGGWKYERVIIDMPATGHTLALTGLPEILLRLIPVGPIARLLKEGQAVVNDPAKSAAWIVALPETLPVSEALELLEGLRETNVPVGGMVLNRLPKNPFSEEERAALIEMLKRQYTLGSLAFEQIEASRVALARLSEGSGLPVVELSAHDCEGEALVAALTHELRVRVSGHSAVLP